MNPEVWTRLAGHVKNIIVLRGGAGVKKRKAEKEQLDRVLLATGKYIGEGFDDSRLDTLFLAMPIAWKGTLQQYAGRLHRLHDGKQVVVVYDYVDGLVPVLDKMFLKRRKGYEAIGSGRQSAPIADELWRDSNWHHGFRASH